MITPETSVSWKTRSSAPARYARIDLIMPSDLPPQIIEHAAEESARKSRAAMPVGKSLDEFIQEQEREYIEATLAKFKGAREKAASVLGISMATLYRKLEIKGKK